MLATRFRSLARRSARLLHRTTGRCQPAIRVHRFSRVRPDLFVPAPAPEGSRLVSQVCRHETLASPGFRAWATRLHYPWQPHRKIWELAYICQVLHERGMLTPGRRGLGFAVGAEKLPAMFAAAGCQITATDLPAEDDRSRPWAASGQWVGRLESLNVEGLCPPEAFQALVSYRPVDMNHIPADLRDYDFTWSTCSFEHCGSLDLGLTFLERQLDCLRPGGVAVHTTEFNLSSNDDTISTGPCVIYRLQDIERVCGRLRDLGHHVEPIDLHPGDTEIDRFVDPPPYGASARRPHGMVKHLRLNLAGFASTSIGVVIRKAG